MDLGGKFIVALEYSLAFWKAWEAEEKVKVGAREITAIAGGAIGGRVLSIFAAVIAVELGIALTGVAAAILGLAVIVLGGYLGAKLSKGIYDTIVEGKLW